MRTVKLTKKQADVLIKVALVVGVRISDTVANRHNNDEYPYFDLDNGEATFWLTPGIITFHDMLDKLVSLEFIRLNDQYSATREGSDIVVGCQKIPVAKVREIYEKLCV